MISNDYFDNGIHLNIKKLDGDFFYVTTSEGGFKSKLMFSKDFLHVSF